MRLWSLHPRYLDAQGLVAVWREGLLARAVLHGQSRGYTHHPQLLRFQQHPEPFDAIDYFLEQVLLEAGNRGYHFDGSKIVQGLNPQKIAVTKSQLEYELAHLNRKFSIRSPERLPLITGVSTPEPNPLFRTVPGPVASWEKVTPA
jgi:hypothetical protein